MTTTIQQHIRLDEQGIAWIDDTNIKVIEVAEEHLAWELSAEEIVKNHPGVYSLAQVHAALAHYYDNKEDFDSLIAKNYAEIQELRAAQKHLPGIKKLHALGHLA